MRVKYESNLGGDDCTVDFPTEREGMEWIADQMQTIWNTYCERFPDADITWLNRYMDVGDTTEIYVPNADAYARCTVL